MRRSDAHDADDGDAVNSSYPPAEFVTTACYHWQLVVDSRRRNEPIDSTGYVCGWNHERHHQRSAVDVSPAVDCDGIADRTGNGHRPWSGRSGVPVSECRGWQRDHARDRL